MQQRATQTLLIYLELLLLVRAGKAGLQFSGEVSRASGFKVWQTDHRVYGPWR